MEESKIYKNITRTVVAIGLSTALINNSSTILINGGDFLMKNSSYFESSGFQANNMALPYVDKNVFVENTITPLEKEAFENFGVMREATKEEIDGVQQYIKNISKPTGFNFFNLC